MECLFSPFKPSVVLSAGAADYWAMGNGWIMMNGRILMVLLWIVFFILMVILIYGLVRGKKTGLWDNSQGETPLALLKRRYARGEITQEEFHQIKKDLLE